MATFLKGLVMLVIIGLALGILNLWYNTYILGSLYANGGVFIMLLGAALPIMVIVGAVYLIKAIVKVK